MSRAPSPTAPVDLSAELTALAGGAAAPAVAVADRLLVLAVAAGASDLHVDPEATDYVVRLRLDGVLHEAARLARAAAPTLVARLKVLAELPTYVVDVPQSGRIKGELVRSRGDLRLSVLPTIHGEKAVVRLLDPGGPAPRLDGLGLPGDAVTALQQAVLAPSGLVVLSGPAGSGKSTTIHAALQRIRERSGGARSVVGIEDPVERVLPGVTQTQVDPAAGFGYAEALRAFLRQDPEVIYLGEVRDAETAGVALEAALTGHLVLTTLHAGSATGVVSRLLEMGLEPHLITSALRAAFAQRLLRRLCAECAQPDVDLRPAWRERLADATAPRRPQGCPACLGTGYRGRLPLVEHVTPSPALRRAVLAREDEEALGAAVAAEGRPTLLDRAVALVAEGTTSIAEVERVLGYLA